MSKFFAKVIEPRDRSGTKRGGPMPQPKSRPQSTLPGDCSVVRGPGKVLSWL